MGLATVIQHSCSCAKAQASLEQSMHVLAHARRTTPSHCVRCILGTALRAAVWGSALNLGLSVAGRTRGFWATKVVNASVRSSRKLLSSRLNVKEAWHELRQATREVPCPGACRKPLCFGHDYVHA